MRTRLKKEYLILLGITVAACLYLYFHQTDRINYRLPEMASLKRADITQIELIRPDEEPLVLERTDGHWRLQPGNYPADENRVGDMLAAVTDMTLTALVSQSEDYHRYGLSPEAALTVTVSGEGETVLREFAVSGKPASHNHTFVRIGDDSRVYHARGRLKNVFDKTVSRLRDKTVLAFDAERVKSIEITTEGDKTVVLEKQPEASAAKAPEGGRPEEAASRADQAGWRTSAGKKADGEAVRSLLETLSTLKCQRFLTKEEGVTLPEPVYRVTVNAGTSHTLSLFSPAEDDSPDYRGTSSLVDSVFALTKNRAETIMKSPTALLVTAGDQ